MSLNILYRDDAFLAVNKPPGLRSTPAFVSDSTTSTSGDGGRKRKRQERFSEVLQSLGSSSSSSSSSASSASSADPMDVHLQKLARESASVPRKIKTFRSYAKRSLRVDDEGAADALFHRIQAAVKREEEREGMRLTDSVLTRVQAAEGRAEAVAVHRLDCETSGVLIVALDPAAGAELNRQFRDGEVKKSYLKTILLIHPDKCSHVDANTAAFQAANDESVAQEANADAAAAEPS